MGVCEEKERKNFSFSAHVWKEYLKREKKWKWQFIIPYLSVRKLWAGQFNDDESGRMRPGWLEQTVAGNSELKLS